MRISQRREFHITFADSDRVVHHAASGKVFVEVLRMWPDDQGKISVAMAGVYIHNKNVYYWSGPINESGIQRDEMIEKVLEKLDVINIVEMDLEQFLKEEAPVE